MEKSQHLSFEDYSKLYVERNGESTPFALRSTYNLYLQTKNSTERKETVEEEQTEPIDTSRTESLSDKPKFASCTKEPTKKELLTIFGFIVGKADKTKIKYLTDKQGNIPFGFSTFPILAGESEELPVGYKLVRQANGTIFTISEFRLEEEATTIVINTKDTPLFTPKSLLSRINEEEEPIVIPIPFLILLLQTRKECVKESPKYALDFTFLTINDDIKVLTLNSDITINGILGNEGGERPYILTSRDLLVLEKFLREENIEDREFPDVLEAVPFGTVNTMIDYYITLQRIIYYYYAVWILDVSVDSEFPYKLEYGFGRKLNILKALKDINEMNIIVYNAFKKAIKLGVFEKNISDNVYSGVNRMALLKENMDESQYANESGETIVDLEEEIQRDIDRK